MDNSLHELDAAHPHGVRPGVHPLQDRLLDSGHLLPQGRGIGMIDAIERLDWPALLHACRLQIRQYQRREQRKRKHIHMSKYQRIYTRRSLHHTLHHGGILRDIV